MLLRNDIFNISEIETILLYIVMIILLIVLLLLYFIRIAPFLRNIKYLKHAIKMSYDDNERKYWKEELKRYYRSMFPFLNLFRK